MHSEQGAADVLSSRQWCAAEGARWEWTARRQGALGQRAPGRAVPAALQPQQVPAGQLSLPGL